jgi:hypothetical protein
VAAISRVAADARLFGASGTLATAVVAKADILGDQGLVEEALALLEEATGPSAPPVWGPQVPSFSFAPLFAAQSKWLNALGRRSEAIDAAHKVTELRRAEFDGLKAPGRPGGSRAIGVYWGLGTSLLAESRLLGGDGRWPQALAAADEAAVLLAEEEDILAPMRPTPRSRAVSADLAAAREQRNNALVALGGSDAQDPPVEEP